MPKFLIAGEQNSLMDFKDSIEGQLNQGVKDYYFDLQGQVLAEGQLKGRNVLIAVDISKNGNLIPGFREQLKGELKNLGKEENLGMQGQTCLGENFKALIKSDQRFSLIPIHKKMYFHALRSANASTDNGNEANQAFKFAYDHVYRLINADIATYLNDHQDFSVQGLNQFIDKQRLKYATVAESMVMSHLVSNQAPLRSAGERKEWLEKHTAADMDFISTNYLTGLLTHVRGPDGGHSSHSKKEQPPAFMKMEQYSLETGGKVQSQFRVPSLTVPKGDQVQDENRPIHAQIRSFMDQPPGGGERLEAKNSPVVYNLFTSLPIGVDSNSQEAAAKKIFNSMHVYNADRGDRPMFYAMNLPINQHTHDLRYDGKAPQAPQREALLLADLAVFNTVGKDMPLIQRIVVNGTLSTEQDKVNALYQEYLANPDREEYFSSSPQGQEAIGLLTEMKAHVKKNGPVLKGGDDSATLVKNAFLKLYADDASQGAPSAG